MTEKEQAAAYFREGYNCAQAVVLTFADRVGIDRDEALRISSSFGGGMGRLREVCGAVSGMFMIAGLVRGYTSPTDGAAKAEHYALIRGMAGEFTGKNGSIVCRRLLEGVQKTEGAADGERTDEYYKKRRCAEYVGDCAEIVLRAVFNGGDTE